MGERFHINSVVMVRKKDNRSRPGEVFATGWCTGPTPIMTCLLGAIRAKEHSLTLNVNRSHRIIDMILMAENWQ